MSIIDCFIAVDCAPSRCCYISILRFCSRPDEWEWEDGEVHDLSYPWLLVRIVTCDEISLPIRTNKPKQSLCHQRLWTNLLFFVSVCPSVKACPSGPSRLLLCWLPREEDSALTPMLELVLESTISKICGTSPLIGILWHSWGSFDCIENLVVLLCSTIVDPILTTT